MFRGDMTARLEELQAALKGRYEIERELGHGGMATVYLANDVERQREVAVKVLRPDLAAALGPERFLREIRIAANLTHPHILPLYDSGEADGFLFYVMPYIEGQTLRDRIEKEGELPVAETIRIIREVVDALAFAHSKGVVHRDIKPDNIMLTGGHAIVADFGVAKAVSEATGRDKLTTAGVALGTPAYMSPEQATADPHVDHRADIYAVGAMAYELLAGRTPFTGATPQSILAAHVTEHAEPVSKYRDHVSTELEALIMRCLEKKPADRWQSAGEMLPHLESMGTSSGGMTPAATMPVAAVSGPKRLFKPLAVGATVVLLASAAVFFGRSDSAAGARGSAIADERRTIAVLPFTTVQTDEESLSFTSGIHDDIRTQLSKIRSLRVTSRASVMGFNTADRNISAIGEQLDVETILAGSVQRSGANVRINLELIDVLTTEVIWGDSYIRELTVDNIFDIQSEIAVAVSGELSAALTPDELAIIGTAPTDNIAAYDALRRGQYFFKRRATASSEDLELAERFYAKAFELDPEFALAWAAHSRANSLMYWLAYDRSPAGIDRALEGASRALELQPDLGEGHLAMGYYHYYANRDYEAALEEFALAERQMPGDAGLLNAMGFVFRRQARWDEAIEMFGAARAIDPADSSRYWSNVGEVQMAQRQYDRAIESFEASFNAEPDFYDVLFFRASAIVARGGGVFGLRDAVDLLPRSVATDVGDLVRWQLHLYERNWDGVLVAFEGEGLISGQVFWAPFSLVRAYAFRRLGDSVAAAEGFAEAESLAAAALVEFPGNESILLARAWSLAGLGRTAEARSIAQAVADGMPVTRDALIAPSYHYQAAAIFALIGDSESALDRIEYVLTNDGPPSAHVVEIDPRFDSIRNHPKYREVLGLE